MELLFFKAAFGTSDDFRCALLKMVFRLDFIFVVILGYVIVIWLQHPCV